MDASVVTAVGLSPASLAFNVTTDEEELEIVLSVPAGGSLTSVTVRGYGATGALVASNIADDITVPGSGSDATNTSNGVATIDFDETSGKIQVDLKTPGIKRLVLSSLVPHTGSAITRATHRISVQALEDDRSAYDYGDGAPEPVTVQAWLDLDADVSDIEATYASAAATVNFYDPKSVVVIPRVERTLSSGNLFNDPSGTDTLTGSIEFVRPDLNLEQVNLAKWWAKVEASTGGTGTTDYNQISHINIDGYTNMDKVGKIHFSLTDSLALSNAYNYKFVVANTEDATRTFNSAAYTPPTNDADREVYPTVTDAVNASQTNTAPGTIDKDITLRPGTAAFTYNARLYDTNTTTRAKVASQLVLATVKAGAFMPTGTELTVSGVNQKITAASEAVVTTGFTDANGDFAITVTSSNPVALTSYTVSFFTLTEQGEWSNSSTATGGGDAVLTATYTAATVTNSSLTVDTPVLAGSSLTAQATVKDSYGVVTNKSGTKDLYITVRASDITDLNETVAVAADGTVSIPFANYLGAGESDSISIYLHTGATWSTTTTNIDTDVISLYNPADAAAVNAPANVTGVITYDDFITGTASATNVAPDDTAISVTGTVVDANGSGIPGAVVTVDGAGMQLRKSGVGDYFQDTITFAADAAGVFTVDLWSHTVNTTGANLTISAGGQTATTVVKTYLPTTGVDGNNLVFGIDAPAEINVNQTYAIQASLTDKWGNPIQTAGGTVDIIGVGSVEINSAAAGATDKNFGKDGKVTVFVRSIKDIEGPGTITATLEAATYTAWTGTETASRDLGLTEITTDVVGTAHDETSFANSVEVNIFVGDAPQSSTQKVNAGSFKGYVAVYARGYEGQRLSAKIGNDWVIVDPIVNNESANLARVTDFTGAGVDIAVRIYIDRVLIDTINLTTK
jgi:hypothetical protein